MRYGFFKERVEKVFVKLAISSHITTLPIQQNYKTLDSRQRLYYFIEVIEGEANQRVGKSTT